MRQAIFAAIAIGAAGGFAQVSWAQSPCDVSDSTFNDGGWGVTTFTTGNGGTSTGSQSTVGNPTPGRFVQNHLNGGAGTLQAFHRYLACDAVIDPSVIPVAWIDFSINAKWTGGLGGNGQQIGLACEQKGIAYRAGGTVTGSSGNWVTINQTLVTPADFVRMDGLAGSLDVSPSGSPIRFGFRTGNANSGANGAVNIEVTYDNFSVTLYCRADFDGDGFVSGADFDQFVLAFESGDMSADFDGDGFITGLDFDKYVQAFEAGC